MLKKTHNNIIRLSHIKPIMYFTIKHVDKVWHNKSVVLLKKIDAFESNCDLAETRTLDPLIKSQLLYQLSYEVRTVNLMH